MGNFIKLFGIAVLIVGLGMVGLIFTMPDLKAKVLGGAPDAEEVEAVPEDVAEAVAMEAEKKVAQSEETRLTATQVEALATKLQEEEQRIQNRVKNLQKREDALAEREAEIRKIMTETGLIRNEISRFISAISESEEKNLKKLARMFETLSPTNATPLLEQMPDETVVNVFALMKPRNSAKLLGSYASTDDLSARRAARITQMLKNLAKPPAAS